MEVLRGRPKISNAALGTRSEECDSKSPGFTDLLQPATSSRFMPQCHDIESSTKFHQGAP